jgi:hypothetical protein
VLSATSSRDSVWIISNLPNLFLAAQCSQKQSWARRDLSAFKMQTNHVWADMRNKRMPFCAKPLIMP